jgi:hypothetical protein
MPTSAAITAALAKAEIPYHTQTGGTGPLHGLRQPIYAIFIPSSRREAAQQVLKTLQVS